MKYLKLLKGVKKFLDSYNEEVETPQIIIISNEENAVDEISYFLTSRKDESFNYISYEELKNLDIELYKRLRSADAVIIYSTNPFSELAEIAYTSSLVSQITFRYLCLLSSAEAEKAKRIIAESININICKLYAFDTRHELLSALPELLVGILPVDCLPYFFKKPGFEEVRRKKALMFSALNIVKGFIVLKLIPIVGLPLSLELFRDGIMIASTADLGESIKGTFPYLGALFFGFLNAKGKIKKKTLRSRFRARKIFQALYVLFMLFLALSGRSKK